MTTRSQVLGLLVAITSTLLAGVAPFRVLSESSTAALSTAVQCWKLSTSPSGAVSTLQTAAGLACPVQVDFPPVSTALRPLDSVPLVWTARLLPASDTTNDLGMPLPPNASVPEIAATYARTCGGASSASTSASASASACDLTAPPELSTPRQTGAFSSSGDPKPFFSLKDVSFPRAGDVAVAAVVEIKNDANPAITYLFATTRVLSVKSASESSPMERGVVRCRMTRQSALEPLLDAAASVSSSASCELGISLAPLPVVRPGQRVSVAWTATLERNRGRQMTLPAPLATATVDGKDVEVVSAMVKLCGNASHSHSNDSDGGSASDSQRCDEYSNPTELLTVGAASPTSFRDGVASFTSEGVTVPTEGWHLAMLHVVLAGANRRFDFTYYFDVVATASDPSAAVDATHLAADASTVYCWSVLAPATAVAAAADATAQVTSMSVVAAGENSDCPFGLSLTLPRVVAVDAKLEASAAVTLSRRETFSQTAFHGFQLSSVYDADAQAPVTVPSIRLFACAADSSDASSCSPFVASANRSLLFSSAGRNLSADGKAELTDAKAKFPSGGNFTVLALAMLPSGARRVDVATLSRVTVVAPPASSSAQTVTSTAAKSSNTAVYVGVGVGCVVLVAAAVLAVRWVREHRRRRYVEKVPGVGVFAGSFSPSKPRSRDMPTATRCSFSSEGSFSFIRAERSPVGVVQDSLSYDPYARPSFTDMAGDETNLSFVFSEADLPNVPSKPEERYDI
ncbi:hypothetical protein PINS_up012682 [Pythium insidiosum]|nr:hypothetical protein PINS_up012682 [Pythium insidiosum]